MRKLRDKDERLPQPDLFGDSSQAGAAQRAKPASQRAHSASAPPSKRIAMPPPVLLNVREAAARLGLSKSTLDKMRCAGKGPRFVKSTARAVRYDPADLDAWISAQRRSSTSEM